MSLAFHMTQGLPYLGPPENLVDNGPDGMELNNAVHTLEHSARADVNTLDSKAVHKDRHGADAWIAAAESADHANRSIHANGSQRAWHSAASTHLNDVVYALAIRQPACFFFPVGRALVINDLVRTKLFRPCKLCITAGNQNDAQTRSFIELKSK